VKGFLAIGFALLMPVICRGAEQTELRGRVVCMLEEAQRKEGSPIVSTNHQHVYGFKTTDGKTHKLVRTKFSEALFVDKRLHEKDLLLKGKLSGDAQTFDPLTIRSIKNGVVNDLYYYCEICAIESISPDICSCCQGPVELVEKPLTDNDHKKSRTSN
jgi:hypothetical protein